MTYKLINLIIYCRGFRKKLSNSKFKLYLMHLVLITLFCFNCLHDNIFGNKVGLFNYTNFRFDRCLSISNSTMGEGVLIGFKTILSSPLFLSPPLVIFSSNFLY